MNIFNADKNVFQAWNLIDLVQISRMTSEVNQPMRRYFNNPFYVYTISETSIYLTNKEFNKSLVQRGNLTLIN